MYYMGNVNDQARYGKILMNRAMLMIRQYMLKLLKAEEKVGHDICMGRFNDQTRQGKTLLGSGKGGTKCLYGPC